MRGTPEATLRASVVIPTHEHASTLPYAVASVQRQGIEDIEILIVGDGVTDDVRAAVTALQADDQRIRFLDFPKGPRLGEVHRNAAVRQAKGRIICYQSDDDLWLPGHLTALEHALADADFAGALQVNVDPDGRVRAYYFDLERPEFVSPWLAWEPNDFGAWACNGFGLQSGAHRRHAYFRLPEGWATTAPGLPSDQTMLHKFAREPWCRMRFLRWPISLHFPNPDRRTWTPAQRAEELAHWNRIILSPDGVERLYREVLADLGDRLLDQSLRDRRLRQELEQSHGRALGVADAERQAASDRIRALEAALDAQQNASTRASIERQAVADAERQAAVARIRALEATLAAEHQAFVARIRELEAELAAKEAAFLGLIADMRATAEGERAAFVARIHGLDRQVEATQDAAERQAAEWQATLTAERAASGARIRALEEQVEAVHAASAQQVAGLQGVMNAERAALVARVHELEELLRSERAASGARTGELKRDPQT